MSSPPIGARRATRSAAKEQDARGTQGRARIRLPRFHSRHWNFYLALGAGALALGICLAADAALSAGIAALVFGLTYVGLTLHDVARLTPDYLRRHAGDEDAPPLVVFALTLAVIVYVTVALFLAINAGKNVDPARLTIGLASVIANWLMIHLMWAMHYAWEYYEGPGDKAPRSRTERGGLDFPGDEPPDGVSFIYFSFVVAMTAQTSDTNVTDNGMRRIVTWQSLFGYLFNTVAVAAAVNMVVALGQQ